MSQHWEHAERQVREIVSAVYTEASQRVNANGTGDVFHLADVMASQPNTKILFAQVKTTSNGLSDVKLNELQRRASSILNEDHAEFELWHQKDRVWEVYQVPLEKLGYYSPTPVRIPLEVQTARVEYKALKQPKRKVKEGS